ncbi:MULTISPECIES: SMP-30/gluconolactonase/LRE family protein [unclassified Streptomyces]|uniref:SMP-30/gluconolactonase/LRE family protein n=1 Tax=unclassified Streptomyces TaxID=2593676 RepID=UPI003800577A
MPRTQLGEGPRLDAATSTLSWVDIVEGRLWVADVVAEAAGAPDGAWLSRPRLVLELPGSLSCAVRAGAGDDWLLATGGTVARWRPGTLPATVAVLEPDPERAHLNDGAVDPTGRFWVGSMDARRPLGPWGRLHLLDPSRSEVVLDGLLAANGIGWSPDGRRMYVVDSGRRIIHRLRPGPTGGWTADGAPLEAPVGVPDGITVDAEGCLWVALWNGGCVVRLSPDGEELRRVEVPCSRPSACTLIGTRLLITTARLPDEPDSGWTYCADTDVPGPPAPRATLL